MNAAAFQLNKVRRLITTQGSKFVFSRVSRNEFGEPDGQSETVEIRGVYHETTNYLPKDTTEATTVRQKYSPMILCLWTDAENLLSSDVLTLNGKSYTIGEMKDLSEARIICDISLTEVQEDGSKF